MAITALLCCTVGTHIWRLMTKFPYNQFNKFPLLSLYKFSNLTYTQASILLSFQCPRFPLCLVFHFLFNRFIIVCYPWPPIFTHFICLLFPAVSNIWLTLSSSNPSLFYFFNHVYATYILHTLQLHKLITTILTKIKYFDIWFTAFMSICSTDILTFLTYRKVLVLYFLPRYTLPQNKCAQTTVHRLNTE